MLTVRDVELYPRTVSSDLINPLCQEQFVWKVVPPNSLLNGSDVFVRRAHDVTGILADIARQVGPPTAMCILGDNVIGAASWEGIPIADQYRAVTERAAAFVASNMHYLRVRGPEAVALLNFLTPRDVGRLPPGRAMFVLFTTPAGTVDEEAIVVRTGVEEFLVSCGGGKPMSWLPDALRSFSRVSIEQPDLVSFNLKGPQRMQAMQSLVSGDDHARVAALRPFDSCAARVADGETVRIVRTTVGYEMWGPVQVIRRVWGRIFQHSDLITPCAWDLLNVYRVECELMVFAVYPIDVHVGTTLWEAGYGWMVEKGPAEYFVGQEALMQSRGRERFRLLGLRAADESVDVPPVGTEIYDRNGAFAGYVTTAAFSIRHGRPLAFAHVRQGLVPGDTLELDGGPGWTLSNLPFDGP